MAEKKAWLLQGDNYRQQVQHNVLHHTYTNIHGHDEDLDAETVKALSHALELDYIEKWKVFAQMKLLERNFAIAEQARVALREQLSTANANVQVLLRNYEEKKIGLDHEIQEKLKVKEELKAVRAELRSLKKPKDSSEEKSDKNKSEPKNA